MYTVVLPSVWLKQATGTNRCKRRLSSKKKNCALKTKHKDWISFALEVHNVTKCNRDQRKEIEEYLSKTMEQEAEEAICSLRLALVLKNSDKTCCKNECDDWK